MPARYAIDEFVALHARTIGDDDAAEEARDAWGEAFGWVDHRSFESEVVEAFAWQLDEGDVLTFVEDEQQRVTPVRNGVPMPVPLTLTGSDRYVMAYSLAQILEDRYEVFQEEDGWGSDTHGFLVLTHADAAALRARHRKWMDKVLKPLQPYGVDGFSGLDVPWYGHEDAAPDFVAKRRKFDEGLRLMGEGISRWFENMHADEEKVKRGEMRAADSFQVVKERQEFLAWTYFAAALASAVVTLMGATFTGTGGFSFVVLVAAGVHHARNASRMRTGWRPSMARRIAPAVVILVMLFSVPHWLEAGGKKETKTLSEKLRELEESKGR